MQVFGILTGRLKQMASSAIRSSKAWERRADAPNEWPQADSVCAAGSQAKTSLPNAATLSVLILFRVFSLSSADCQPSVQNAGVPRRIPARMQRFASGTNAFSFAEDHRCTAHRRN